MGSPDAKTRDAHVARLIEEGFAKIPDSSVFVASPVTGVAPVEAVAVTPVTPVTPLAPAAPADAPGDTAPAVRFVVPKR